MATVVRNLSPTIIMGTFIRTVLQANCHACRLKVPNLRLTGYYRIRAVANMNMYDNAKLILYMVKDLLNQGHIYLLQSLSMK